MTHIEARRRIEASSGFDIRDGRVWLREVRWLRAVDQLRHEGAEAPEPVASAWDPAWTLGRGGANGPGTRVSPLP